ncbi:hypothetical protein DUI87_08804 [Hirundo rustica rustica]|uniref:Uncharacterized protein n=1 Tax=Hirundo rustica rustica TaxID=333673 RepID=A0A3M0KQY8_HIRRU|nr:hypothetical protein DUI87_08804 [Hirundo rustica rustica]
MLARDVIPDAYHAHSLLQLQLFSSMRLLMVTQEEIRFRNQFSPAVPSLSAHMPDKVSFYAGEDKRDMEFLEQVQRNVTKVAKKPKPLL